MKYEDVDGKVGKSYNKLSRKDNFCDYEVIFIANVVSLTIDTIQ